MYLHPAPGISDIQSYVGNKERYAEACAWIHIQICARRQYYILYTSRVMEARKIGWVREIRKAVFLASV